MIYQIKPDAQIVFLDTDLHFQETYDLIDRVKERFPKLRIEMKKPELTLEEQAEKYNPALWKNNPNQCCYIRKIKPLEEVLGGAIAWISGLRRDQSPTRAKTNFVNKDERFKSIKVCPLIYWTEDDVWDYIKQQTNMIYLIMNFMTSIIQVLVVFLVQRQYSIQMIPEQDVGQVLKNRMWTSCCR